LQNVISHGLKSGRTIHFQRCVPAGTPTSQDEIWVTGRVIGMEVRHKNHLQVGGLELSDATIENSSFGATDNTRSKIDKICAVVNNDGGKWGKPGGRG
jgi:hypothetical protein